MCSNININIWRLCYIFSSYTLLLVFGRHGPSERDMLAFKAL
jgi:hypothetical protein